MSKRRRGEISLAERSEGERGKGKGAQRGHSTSGEL